jgi:hypothetical protein
MGKEEGCRLGLAEDPGGLKEALIDAIRFAAEEGHRDLAVRLFEISCMIQDEEKGLLC